MSYEQTEVPVSRSQEGIRKIIMGRQGSKVAFISDPPLEGFEAQVMIEDLPYRIRIMGVCKDAPLTKKRTHYRYGVVGEKETTDKFKEEFRTKEERRIWRVLFYHLKSLFETADSGVKELRELMLAYIVTKDGRTVAERVIPQLAAVMSGRSPFLLTAGNVEEVSAVAAGE